MSDEGRLLSIDAVRGALGGVSVGTIYNLIRTGELPVVKVRSRTLFRTEDVVELIDRCRHESTPPRTEGQVVRPTTADS